MTVVPDTASPYATSMQAAVIPIENTTVHASAGSGKTYLLVSRVIQLLLNGTEPGNILAITFTRKAAAEMQARLLQRLFELASSEPEQLSDQLQAIGASHDPATQDRARRLYEDLLNADSPVSTTTFHAFCQDLLRRFPLEADVPAGFDLLEQTGSLQDEAWESLMDEAGTKPDSELAQAITLLFKQLTLFNTRQALMSFVQQRSDWWAYTQGQNDVLHYAAQKLASQLNIQPGQDPLPEFVADPQLISRLQRYLEYLARRNLTSNQKLARQIEMGLDDRLALPQRYQHIRQSFLTQKGDIRKQKASAAMEKDYGAEGMEEFLALHQTCAELILNIDEQLAAQQTWQLTMAWYRAGHHLLLHYQRIKQEQRLLDFGDLEWKTYQLLNRSEYATWVQYKLDNRIKHLLIDEFQDTNPTQWQLILPLLEEFASKTEADSNSVFLVGDAKQSIYRFRRAEPRLFNTASHWLQKNMQAVSQPLNKSWRSSQAIIDFVNRLFSNGELHDQLPDFIPHETVHRTLAGKVTLLPLIHNEPPQTQDEDVLTLRNPLKTPRDTTEDPAQTEGQQVADTIQGLIKQSLLVGEGDAARPIQYRDILILLRSRTHVSEFEHALRQRSIPFLGAERGTLLDALEIIDMSMLLQWLLSPYDNHALASILRSPLFNASDDDLLMLAAGGKANWFECMVKLQDELPVDSALYRAGKLLGKWQTLARQLPVHDLLDRIYSEANVLACYSSAFPASLKSRVASNLVRFMELALESDSGRYPSLTRFMSWLNELKQKTSEAPDEPPGEGQEDRCRLLTIHEAKGLEAPVVFLVDSARPLQNRTAYAALVDWAGSQLQPETFLLTGRKEQLDCYSRDKLELLARLNNIEETNLLYVAVTRARQFLYISGTEARRNKNRSWYESICLQHDLDMATVEQVINLHASGEVTQGSPRKKPHVASALHIDEGLLQPVPQIKQRREIAPSRQVQHTDLDKPVLDEDARRRGVSIHCLIDKLSSKKDLSDTQLAALSGLPEDSSHFRGYLAEARGLLLAPHLQTIFDKQHYVQAYNEIPLFYEQDGQAVYGIIDRLVVYQDRIVLLDYKTHRVDPEHYPQLAAEFQPQLKYYTEGIKKIWPDREIKAYLLFTHSATLCPVDV